MQAHPSAYPDTHDVDLGGQRQAFILLEAARLRCERLAAQAVPAESVRMIHREIGLAGYITSEDFNADLRALCLAHAHAHLDEHTTPAPTENSLLAISRTLTTMFSETIAASDALASELADHGVDDACRDRLREVHTHVMCACEQLDERLTLLELEGPSTTLG